jgi:hypothetical protein
MTSSAVVMKSLFLTKNGPESCDSGPWSFMASHSDHRVRARGGLRASRLTGVVAAMVDHTVLVTPGTAMGYSPFAFGTLGGTPSIVYDDGRSAILDVNA